MARVHFIVNGLGLGNSTRCHSIIQRLHESAVTIDVTTSGNGLWYFAGRPEVGNITELGSLRYGASEGKISIAKTIRSLPRMFDTLRHNARTLTSVLARQRPDVVVTDSEYSFWPVKKLGIPLIAVNNSDVVVQSMKRFSPVPKNIVAQFYAVEKSDYLFHKTVPNLVLSPTLEPNLPGIHHRFKRVPAIVRSQCAPSGHGEGCNNVTVMLSGSIFGSPVQLSDRDFPFQIDVLGRSAPEDYKQNECIRYHNKVRESADLVAGADLVVINGGFSAVSEAFVMQKPMVVIPVPGHAEQWINARTIDNLGVGMIADEDELEQAMMDAYSRINMFRDAYQTLPPLRSGACEAAKLILDFIHGSA